MGDVAVRAQGLSKQYRIGKQQHYRDFRDVLTDAIYAPFRRASSLLRGNAYAAGNLDEIFWALKNVSFEVKKGDVIGIIGRNGAGKSTLLKILSQITEPTEGQVDIYGRVGALLEVGTGFHPELTGRENIYLNGAILGMSREEIRRKFDEIVAFAEVEQFIDTPVKHYSSGMGLRLGFAVAAHLEPEILIVDEVLAVGDVAFQKRCLGKIDDVAHEGRTVLFVSHSMAAIKRLCNRSIWLDHGMVISDGLSDEIIAQYLTESTSEQGERVWPDGFSNYGVSELKLLSIRLLNSQGEVSSSHEIGNGFALEIEYHVFERLPYCRVGWGLSTATGTHVMESYDSDNEMYSGVVEPGRYMIRCEIPSNLLNDGYYLITINAGIPQIKNLAHIDDVLTVNIVDTGGAGSNMPATRGGIIRTKLNWRREKRI